MTAPAEPKSKLKEKGISDLSTDQLIQRRPIMA